MCVRVCAGARAHVCVGVCVSVPETLSARSAWKPPWEHVRVGSGGATLNVLLMAHELLGCRLACVTHARAPGFHIHD